MPSLEEGIAEAFEGRDSLKVIELLDRQPSLAGLTNRLNQDVLWFASSYGMIDVVKHLMQPRFEKHVDIFKMDVARRDAYDIAEIYGHENIMSYLRETYEAQLAKSAMLATNGNKIKVLLDNIEVKFRNFINRLFDWEVNRRRPVLTRTSQHPAAASPFSTKSRRNGFENHTNHGWRFGWVAVVVVALSYPIYLFMDERNQQIDVRNLVASGGDKGLSNAIQILLSKSRERPAFFDMFAPDYRAGRKYSSQDNPFIDEMRKMGWEFGVSRDLRFPDGVSGSSGEKGDYLDESIQCSLKFTKNNGSEFDSAIQAFHVSSDNPEIRRSVELVPEELRALQNGILEFSITYCFY